MLYSENDHGFVEFVDGDHYYEPGYRHVGVMCLNLVNEISILTTYV